MRMNIVSDYYPSPLNITLMMIINIIFITIASSLRILTPPVIGLALPLLLVKMVGSLDHGNVKLLMSYVLEDDYNEE